MGIPVKKVTGWMPMALVWLVVAGMLFMRLTTFGDLRLSIANDDTPGYIRAGSKPMLAGDMLTRSRLLTTNLVYHLANLQGCQILALSRPAAQTEGDRMLQPCFDRIAVFQNILSAAAWATLALTVARWLNGSFQKILAALLICGFGFTPPIADWDSILGSESLTYSLFALSLALVIEVVFQVSRNKYPTGWLLGSLPLLGFWVFTRDSNLYPLLILLAIGAVSLLVIRAGRQGIWAFVTQLLLAVIALGGQRSAMVSRRWELPMRHVYQDLLLPFPARVDFLAGLGMPHADTQEFEVWFKLQAPSAYAKFLFAHPGYVLSTLGREIEGIFGENAQPYFYAEKSPGRLALTTAGDLLHPKSLLVLLLNVISLPACWLAFLQRRQAWFGAWTWLLTFLFLSASVVGLLGLLADSIGLTRHTMFGVEVFRLNLWLFWLILMDAAGAGKHITAPQSP